jgi:hypothetical protein
MESAKNVTKLADEVQRAAKPNSRRKVMVMAIAIPLGTVAVVLVCYAFQTLRMKAMKNKKALKIRPENYKSG